MTCFKTLYISIKSDYFRAYSKGISNRGKYMSSYERFEWICKIFDYEEYCLINHNQADILIAFIRANARTHEDDLELLKKSSKFHNL